MKKGTGRTGRAGKSGVGEIVVLYLKEPREKLWGVLLETSSSGVWFRGLELNAFEDFARQSAKGDECRVSPGTLFVPYLRVEKIILDESCGALPSFSARFERIAGVRAKKKLLEEG